MPNVLVEEKIAPPSVTLNRPERRNALTIELITELSDALDAAERRSHAAHPDSARGRQGVLRRTRLAGNDLIEKAHRSAEMVAKTLLAISQTRLITIAQIHGAAVAGGAGLMSACDFVVAAERTKIGYPEADAVSWPDSS